MSYDESGFGSPTNFYEDFYDRVICAGGLGGRAVGQTHRAMEDPLEGKSFRVCVEIGAGRGEHVPYVKHDFDYHLMIDRRHPSSMAVEVGGGGLDFMVGDAQALALRDHSIDMVIVTCVAHHVENPELLFNEVNRILVKREGNATIFIPCDPGIIVRVARKWSTEKRASRLGFAEYSMMIAREHRNQVGSLLLIA